MTRLDYYIKHDRGLSLKYCIFIVLLFTNIFFCNLIFNDYLIIALVTLYVYNMYDYECIVIDQD